MIVGALSRAPLLKRLGNHCKITKNRHSFDKYNRKILRVFERMLKHEEVDELMEFVDELQKLNACFIDACGITQRMLTPQSEDKYYYDIKKLSEENLNTINSKAHNTYESGLLLLNTPLPNETPVDTPELTRLKRRHIEKVEIQSSDKELVSKNLSSASDGTQQQTAAFQDERSGAELDMGENIAISHGDKSQNIELSDFLRRPVVIHTDTWAEGAGYETTLQPWDLYFGTAQIQNKLDNYYLLKCNLHLKLMINASPFYYGCLAVAYQPYAFATASVKDAGTINNFRLSQKPIVYMYPQKSQGASMKLPFISNKEWLDATSQLELQRFGELYIKSFGDLKNANSVTGTSCTIRVYAWAEDIELAGPTQALAVQSSDKDEYNREGIISKPASAVANFAGKLTNIPIIGEFATATSMAAGIVGDIASIFGFSKVPNVNPTQGFAPRNLPNFTNPDIGGPIEKLTYDGKNELSIDPKICGVPLGDELTITSFVQREALVAIRTWASTATSGDLIHNNYVHPGLTVHTAGTNVDMFDFTPMSYAAMFFSKWRGDIIVRVKIICSQYHRGRLEFFWDPHVALNTISNTSHVNYTQIVDISECDDIEFRIPYTQTTAYRDVNNDHTVNDNSTSFLPSATSSQYNGTFGIKVLTAQTSPVQSADITVLVYIKAADNFEFADPRQLPSYSPYDVQSQDKDFDVDKLVVDLGVKPSTTKPEINLIYMGETVKSFRTLFQRGTHYTCKSSTLGTTGDRLRTISMREPRFPRFFGYDPDGLDSAIGLNSLVSENFNYTHNSVFNLLSLCFVGMRGSIVYYTNMPTKDPNTDIWYEAHIARYAGTSRVITVTDTLLSSEDAIRRFGMTGRIQPSSALNAGASVINSDINTSVMASVPMYREYKFGYTGPNVRTDGIISDASDRDGVKFNFFGRKNITETEYMYSDVFNHAGLDYSLVFFCGTPRLYDYSSFPVAP